MMRLTLRLFPAFFALLACSSFLPAVSRADVQPQEPAPANSPVAHLHDEWDGLLKAHVRGGRVDYIALATRDVGKLDRYLGRLATVQADTLPGPDRVAYWLNLYNATVVRAVCARYREGWRPDSDAYSLFKAPLVRTPDGAMPLDALEHTILRRRVQDPRIHVALCCAAVSCPPIQPRAYRGATVDSLLEVDMRAFVGDAGSNRFDATKRTATLSKIFEWYRPDFGGSERLPELLKSFGAPNIQGWTVNYADYDWALNIVAAGSAPAAPPAAGKRAKKK